MTELHVVDRLSLWVGGDLAENDRDAVQAHLDRCPECRAAARALTESRAWLLQDSVPPFTAEDRLSLRADVMARIRAEHPRRLRSWPQLLLAAAALGGVLLYQNRPRPEPPSVAQRPAPAALPVPAPDPPSPAIPVHRVRRHPSPIIPTEVPELALARIELQTDNPNIRIIWLARSTAPVAPPDQRVNPS